MRIKVWIQQQKVMVTLIYLLNVNAENAEMSKLQEQEKEDDLSDQDESMFNEGALNAL